MDNTHLHLILNHFPIVGTMIGTIILLVAVVRKNETLQQTALIIMFAMALLAIPVFLTGEDAEETAENIPGVLKAAIHQHEESAEVAFWIMMAAGLMSLLTLAMQLLKTQIAKTLVMISLILSIASSVMMTRTGYYGGKIRHTEINGINVPATDTTHQNEGDED